MKKKNRFCFRIFSTDSLISLHALWIAILFIFLCAPAHVHAHVHAHGHGHGHDFNYITAPEVKNMIEKDPRVVLINVLSTIEYDGLHISGSINIPIIKFLTSELLPQNMDTPIITYCMGES